MSAVVEAVAVGVVATFSLLAPLAYSSEWVRSRQFVAWRLPRDVLPT